MSKRDLQNIANAIVAGLVDRGLLPSNHRASHADTGETDGFWCKIADVRHGIIDVWLDGWRSRSGPELYYGFWSKAAGEVQRVRSIFCDEDDCVSISKKDQVEGLRSSPQSKVWELSDKKSRQASGRFLIHSEASHNWFGRYSEALDANEIVREATEFFDLLLRESYQAGWEGSLKASYVNRYEQDPALRAEAIRIHRCFCNICDFDFEATYGDGIGRGFIHVHHLTPLAARQGEGRVTDPETDLLTICPNCHAMLHRRDPPLKPDELRQIMEQQRKTRRES